MQYSGRFQEKPDMDLFECDDCNPQCLKKFCSKLIGVKHYVPGTPEFDAVAKTITHITKVPSRTPEPMTYINADKVKIKSTRNETNDKLR
jgi:hypothetical protein